MFTLHNSTAMPDSVQTEGSKTVCLVKRGDRQPTSTETVGESLPGALVQESTLLCSGISNMEKWAFQCTVTALPADHGVFALYLVHRIQQGSSVSLLNSAFYGASWVHMKSAYPELGVHPLVQQVAEADKET